MLAIHVVATHGARCATFVKCALGTTAVAENVKAHQPHHKKTLGEEETLGPAIDEPKNSDKRNELPARCNW